jgi:hypothetical protein
VGRQQGYSPSALVENQHGEAEGPTGTLWGA